MSETMLTCFCELRFLQSSSFVGTMQFRDTSHRCKIVKFVTVYN